MQHKLLDEILPKYDVSAKYSIRVNAPPERIYRALNEGLPVGAITKLLMTLRGLPRLFRKPKEDVSPESAFYRLKQLENREVVIGIIGQFWKPVSRPLKIQSLDEFLNFQKDGFCKAALNLRIEEREPGICDVITETRVLSYGSAVSSFKEYWRVIKPFSGMIRREILRKIKQKAERPARRTR
ncbi:MAG TPA: hypothetical protein VLH08_10035 [Acidobacteriota bacterium]|nr:hypothetical protein [Acidobacteriota bacterium]